MCGPQPIIGFPYYEILGPDICSLSLGGGGAITTGSYKPGISEWRLPAALSGGVEVYTALHCSLIYAITKLLFMPAILLSPSKVKNF